MFFYTCVCLIRALQSRFTWLPTNWSAYVLLMFQAASLLQMLLIATDVFFKAESSLTFQKVR